METTITLAEAEGRLRESARCGTLRAYESASLVDGDPWGEVPPAGRVFVDPDDTINVDVADETLADGFRTVELGPSPGLWAELVPRCERCPQPVERPDHAYSPRLGEVVCDDCYVEAGEPDLA